jgi:PAS domain S-box-containing protein
VFEKGEALSAQHEHVLPDGSRRFFDILYSPLADDQGRITHAIEGIRDITDQLEAQEALRESESRFRTLFESAADGVLLVDLETGRLFMPNRRMREMLGYETHELCKLTIDDIHPQGDLSGAGGQRDDQMEGGSSTARDVPVLRKNGSILYTDVHAARVKLDGKVYLMGLFRDVTERREAEARRRKLERQLQRSQRLEALGHLAGGVAHDFNNILMAILGNVELSLDAMRQELGSGHGAVRSMEEIESSAQRAADLTRQLLTFSRRDVKQSEVLDLNSVLSDLDKMLRRLINEDIVLVISGAEKLRRIRADPGQIEQVVVNLVVNAVHAMPQGGRLTLETSNYVVDDGYLSRHADARLGAHVLLTVSDTGHGMDASTVDHIFEPFFTTKDGGSGLGLATVHGVVTQSGGHIVVSSEPGIGTVFKVYFPVCYEEPESSAAAGAEGRRLEGSETILVCEDDDRVRDVTTKMLRSAGYTVLSVEAASKALELARERSAPIALLVTDVIIPDMNGRVLSDRMREIRPDLRTLFMSGYTANVIAHHGVLDENVEFLSKPFSRQGLLEKVRSVLDKE